MSALTVHNAEIKTAAVEVRTLTISGKQVTLAVFRQLREEPLIAEDGTLNGVPWGIVNYHPDKCGGPNESEHWHVVWQRGTELLRSAVIVQPQFGRFQSGALGSHLYSSHLRDLVSSGSSELWQGKLPRLTRWGRNDDVELQFEVDGLPAWAKPTDAALKAVDALIALRDAEKEATLNGGRTTYVNDSGITTWGSLESVRQILSARIDATLEDLDAELGPRRADSSQQLLARLRKEVASEAARRQRHMDVCKALADLPQLFIAV